MKIGITQFIPENIAPSNARELVIFNGSKKVGTVDISKMQPSNLGNMLYSFGLIGDMHIGSSGHDGYLNDALTLFENQGCQFCTHVGDMTNLGLWNNGALYTEQINGYKTVIDNHPNLPVYGTCGNHESYNRAIMENLAELVAYTGTPLYYTMTSGESVNPTANGGNIHNAIVGDDVFVFLGQPSGTPQAFNGEYRNVWVTELDWLEATLEANKDRRCLVYEHLTLTDDAGNPNNIHNAYWGDLESRLFSILSRYKNVIVFHGHSHLDLSEQLNFSYANYTEKNGFKSIHAGAPCGGRITIDGVLQKNEGVNGCGSPTKRGGYIVEVYENHIVLRGYYFATGDFVPIAQYCINTTL
jgi:predicted phosphodiesterase